MTRYFSAYNLTLQCDINLEIPTVTVSPSPDVNIHFGDISETAKNYTFDGVWYNHLAHDQLLLAWDIIGSYLIRFGKEVLVHPNTPPDYDNIRQPILGTIMAVVLQQRGCLVLHGSAIVIENMVWLFIGSKGQGKSTLASWMNKLGFPLLSDDICATDHAADQSLVLRPSFPRIKLNPDTLSFLEEIPEHHPKIHPKAEKRVLEVGRGFCETTMPVGAICVLASGDNVSIEQLYGVEAIKQILAHMLINRFPENQPVKLREKTFMQAATVAKSVPVYRLTRPRNFDLLPDTTRLLEATARHLQP